MAQAAKKQEEETAGTGPAPIRYSVTDAAVAELRKNYLKLTIKGLEDRDGYAAVHKARMDVKGRRVDVEKTRKMLKADALEYGRKVDAEARRITELLAPIEEHLAGEEARIDEERARLKREAEEREAARVQARVDALAVYGVSFPVADVAAATDEDFQATLEEAKRLHEEEQARLAEEARLRAEQEEAERKAREEEAARLAAERAELERMRREQEEREAAARAEQERQRQEIEAAQAKIRAEREALESEKRAKEEAERRERLAKEAAERAAQAERERIAREAAEKEAAEQAAREEEARQEALRPDREKLRAYAAALQAVPTPELATDAAKALLADASKRLLALSAAIVKGAATL